MLTVEDYGKIRRAHHDGMSIRAMARVFHRSRCKIREALARPQPEGYTRSKDQPACLSRRRRQAPKLGLFKERGRNNFPTFPMMRYDPAVARRSPSFPSRRTACNPTVR